MRSKLPGAPTEPLQLMGSALLASALLAFAAPSPSQAQIEGLSYSITPEVDWVRWESELGLEDATLYGARLGMRFGRTMALEGFYLQNDEIQTELSAGDFPGFDPTPFQNQTVGAKRYGADLVLNLSRGRWVPYLDIGGSIHRFDPKFGPTFDEIGLQFGGGVRYLVTPRMQARLALQNARFRTDRFQLAPVPESGSQGEVPLDPARDDFRNHLAVSLGVDVQLGGYDTNAETEVDRALRARYQAGIRGAAWPIEPFVGTLRYDGSFGLADQNVLGVRSGIDFGTYLGLRAYYARGMEDGFDDVDPFQTYGAELQFLLSPGPGVRPYLIGGVGYLDFLDSFRTADGSTPDDETALVAGGGLRFDLGQHFHVDLSARDYITSPRDDFADVRKASDLSDSWLYSGGLTFQIGGGGDVPTIGKGDAVPVPTERAPRPMNEDGSDAREAGVTGGSATRDIATAKGGTTAGNDATAGHATHAGGASATASGEMGSALRAETTSAGTMSGHAATDSTSVSASSTVDHRSDRTILLPIPKEGEIYVRYGSPGGVSVESWYGGGDASGSAAAPSPEAAWEARLRRLIREEMNARSGADSSQTAPGSQTVSESRTANGAEAAPALQTTPAEADGPTTGNALTPADLRSALVDLEARLAQRIDERVEEKVGTIGREAQGADQTNSVARETKGARTSADIAGNATSDTDTAKVDRAKTVATEAGQADEAGVDEAGVDEVVVAPVPVIVETESADGSGGRSLRGVAPYGAVSFDDPKQFSLGARADLGPIFGSAPLDLVPEFSVSLADDTTWLLGVNARWLVLGRESARAWHPYVHAGPALLGFDASVPGYDRTNIVFDVGYGIEHDLGRFRVFAEHQGIDMFDYNRIVFGVSGFRR
ncbi:MAG: hypothetical protein R3E97_01020 [Candidatus Eisenbacteria bacterium]